MTEDTEITTVSEKGQVVIPQSLRKQMRITPNTKFAVFGRGDTVVMKRLALPDMRREWDEIFKIMDDKKLRISGKEITAQVQASRKEKARGER